MPKPSYGQNIIVENMLGEKLNYSYGNFLSQSYKKSHQLGATFSKNILISEKENNQTNIKKIPLFLKRKFDNKFEIIGSRSSIRSSTKNRLPYFGSLNKEKEFFIGGMGSWGFSYAPFIADLLVRKILNEPLIIEKKLFNLLNVKNRI